MKFDKSRLRRNYFFAALMAAAMLSASSRPAHADDTVKVAFLGAKGSTFENAIYKGLTSVHGISADFIEVGFDVNKQSQAVDDAIVSGKYKAVVMMPNSPTGLIPAVTRAIQAGLQVVNVEASLGPDIKRSAVQVAGEAASIVEPFDQLSEIQTQMALKYCKDAAIKLCKIARIGGLPQFGTEMVFAEHTKSVIKLAGPMAEMIGPIYAGGYGPNEALKAAQDLLTAHPDVNVILSADPLLTGIDRAVKQAGAKVTLIGIGGSVPGMAKVKSGEWQGDVAFFPEYAGKLTGDAVIRHVKDPKLPGESISPSMPGAGPGFTKETAATFGGQYD